MKPEQVVPSDKRKLRETVYSSDWSPIFEAGYATVGNSRNVPYSGLQSLMETRPHEEPRATLADAMDLREILADAVDALDARQKWVFEATHYRGMSVRQIAAEMSIGKSTVNNIYHDACATLAEWLQNNGVGPHGFLEAIGETSS